MTEIGSLDGRRQVKKEKEVGGSQLEDRTWGPVKEGNEISEMMVKKDLRVVGALVRFLPFGVVAPASLLVVTLPLALRMPMRCVRALGVHSATDEISG